MFKNERSLAQWLIEAIKACNLSSVRIPKESYEDILTKHFGSYAPMIIAKPDIILVVRDYRRIVDELLLIAVELKYFRKFEKKSWKGAYREVGQAPRYYVYGFDSVVLWHVFEGGVL